jgi:hypothetical protein
MTLSDIDACTTFMTDQQVSQGARTGETPNMGREEPCSTMLHIFLSWSGVNQWQQHASLAMQEWYFSRLGWICHWRGTRQVNAKGGA